MGENVTPPPEAATPLDLLAHLQQGLALRGHDFAGANLVDTNLAGRDLCALRARGAHFGGANLRRCLLREADLQEADFSAADLSDADLHGADLRQGNLAGARLFRACLTEADLSEAQLADQDLTGVRLERSRLRGADLRRASLHHARLAGADLRGCRLSGADLRGADLQETDLRGADLRDTDLGGACLTRAKLEEADLHGARLDWVQGLPLADRQELVARGVRTPRTWVGWQWSRGNDLLGRQPFFFYLLSLVVIGGLAIFFALRLGERMKVPTAYPLAMDGADPLFSVDCGSDEDHPFDGQVGYMGGRAFRGQSHQPGADTSSGFYAHGHQGQAFAYRFRVGRGWFLVELHFLETQRRQPGERVFQLRLEEELVAQDFDILRETSPFEPLVRRWVVWVEDGLLDLQLTGKGASKALLNGARVWRQDLPDDWVPRRDD